MASISASIELYDKMSAPLNKIMNTMNQVVGTVHEMNSAMDSGVDPTSWNTVEQAVNEANAAMEETNRWIQENADSQEQLNKSIQTGASNSNDLLQKIMGIAGAYISIKALGNVLDVADELTSTTARINTMNEAFNKTNGTATQTNELVQKIYASAQDARGSFADMADVVARFGNNAKDAFSSQDEVISFANLIQKQMTIAGASTQEASNAMLQLSQALGSGVLRGDELNSIFEQAPNLIQSIADYLEVPIGQIRSMASEGQLSADVVKAAIFASADDINAKFEAMPMTWSQVWTSFQNTALMAFKPVLNKITELASNEDFQNFVNGALGALATLSEMILSFFETMGAIATFVADNWSVIEPFVWGVVTALGAYLVVAALVAAINGVMAIASGIKAAADLMQAGTTFAATAAQEGLNAALLACPITWIVLLVIALVAAIIAVCQWIANATGVANSWFGVMTGGINVVIQFFKNLGLTVADIALGIWNALGACCTNIGVAFNNVISNVQSWFYNLLSTALTVVAGICEALNKLPFVEFDYSGITSAADEYASKASTAANNTEEYTSIADAFNSGMSTFDTYQDGWASDAFEAGASWGDGIADSVSNMFSTDSLSDLMNTDTSFLADSYATDMANTASNTADTANAASSIADSVDISSENLKYLRDIAETEAINRFTTAEIKVDMTNNNTVNSSMDIDGMVDSLSQGVLEAMEMAAEGVH